MIKYDPNLYTRIEYDDVFDRLIAKTTHQININNIDNYNVNKNEVVLTATKSLFEAENTILEFEKSVIADGVFIGYNNEESRTKTFGKISGSVVLPDYEQKIIIEVNPKEKDKRRILDRYNFLLIEDSFLKLYVPDEQEVRTDNLNNILKSVFNSFCIRKSFLRIAPMVIMNNIQADIRKRRDRDPILMIDNSYVDNFFEKIKRLETEALMGLRIHALKGDVTIKNTTLPDLEIRIEAHDKDPLPEINESVMIDNTIFTSTKGEHSVIGLNILSRHINIKNTNIENRDTFFFQGDRINILGEEKNLPTNKILFVNSKIRGANLLYITNKKQGTIVLRNKIELKTDSKIAQDGTLSIENKERGKILLSDVAIVNYSKNLEVYLKANSKRLFLEDVTLFVNTGMAVVRDSVIVNAKVERHGTSPMFFMIDHSKICGYRNEDPIRLVVCQSIKDFEIRTNVLLPIKEEDSNIKKMRVVKTHSDITPNVNFSNNNDLSELEELDIEINQGVGVTFADSIIAGSLKMRVGSIECSNVSLKGSNIISGTSNIINSSMTNAEIVNIDVLKESTIEDERVEFNSASSLSNYYSSKLKEPLGVKSSIASTNEKRRDQEIIDF